MFLTYSKPFCTEHTIGLFDLNIFKVSRTLWECRSSVRPVFTIYSDSYLLKLCKLTAADVEIHIAAVGIFVACTFFEKTLSVVEKV